MEMHTKLRLARKKAGLNQSQAGEACDGITKAAISQWENNNSEIRTAPRLEYLRILAKLYDVSLGALVDNDLNLEGKHEEHTLDNAPMCESVYLLKINAMDLDGAQNGTVLKIKKWDEVSAQKAVIVLFRLNDHKRSMLLQLAYNGDSVCFVPPRIVADGSPRSDARYGLSDGEVLGVVRSVAHDPKLWRNL